MPRRPRREPVFPDAPEREISADEAERFRRRPPLPDLNQPQGVKSFWARRHAKQPVVYHCAADMPGAKPLYNIRWEMFAQHVARGVDRKKAYAAAGFESENAANGVCRLMRETAVLDRIEYHSRLIVDSAGVTREWVIDQLRQVASSNMSNVAEWDGASVTLKDSEDLPSDITAAVAEVSQTKEGVKIKLHSKLDALTKLGQKHGLFIERQEVSGPGGAPVRAITNEMSAQEAAEAYMDLVKETT